MSVGYLVGRLGQGVLVLLGVSVVVFALTWLSGDPSSVLLPPATPPEQIAAFRHSLGLDQPVPMQYLAFLGRKANTPACDLEWGEAEEVMPL